jgi:Flp pilus assembly pilin Flp
VVPIDRRSGSNERGQALVEYAVIVALIGACLVAVLGLVGRATRNAYEQTSTTVSQQTGSGGYLGGGGGGGGGGGFSANVHVIPAGSDAPTDSLAGAGSQDSATAARSTR